LPALDAQLLDKLAREWTEPAAVTRRLIEGAWPRLLNALRLEGSTEEGASKILNFLHDPQVADTEAEADPGVQRRVVEFLFGGRLRESAQQLARLTGAETSSAYAALGLASAFALRHILQERPAPSWTPADLSAYLGGRPPLAPALPGEGVSLLARLAQVGLVLALTLGIGIGSRACSQGPRMVSLDLPGGGRISVLENSINYNLARYLGAGSATGERTFVFDQLNFFTGETRITPESEPTLAAMAAILKAYPKVEVRLEGHTDNQGDATSNQTLSMNRAEAIKQRLAASGVDAARMATAGYGQEKPVAPNTDEAGRARNRRLELAVLKK
jgi:flagellar motor protein MotB